LHISQQADKRMVLDIAAVLPNEIALDIIQSSEHKDTVINCA